MDTGNIAQGAITGKRIKKLKRIVRADEEMDARNLAEGNLIIKKPKIKDEVQKIRAEGIVNIGNAKIQDETQSVYNTVLDNGQAQSVGTKMKKRRKKKSKLVDEVQKEMNAESTENLDEENVTIEKPKVKDQLQSVGLTQMNAGTGSIEILADGKVITKNPDTPVEAQSLDRNTTDMCQLEENLAQGNVAGKRRKKRNEKKTKVNDKVQNLAQSQMDTGLTDDVAEGNLTIENPEVQDEIQSTDQAKINRPVQDLAEGNVNVKRTRNKKRRKKAKGKDEFSSRMDAGSTENLDKVNVDIKIPETRDEVASTGLKVMDAGSTENLTNGSLTSENPKKNDGGQSMDTGSTEDFAKAGKKKKKRRIHTEGNVTIGNQKVQESQSIDQAQMNTPTQDLAEGNVIVNRKKKRTSSKKARVKDEFSGRMDAKSTENVVIVDVKNIISETRDEVSGSLKVMGAGSMENLSKGSLTFENQKNKDEGPSTEKVLINTEPAKDFTKSRKRKKKRKGARKANIDSESRVSIGRTIVSVRRKLLVLDINGLLADVVFPAPKACTADIKLYGRAGDPSVMIF